VPKADRWDAQQWEAATMDLLRRDGDRCWLCGKAFGGDGVRHHRQPRRVQGDRLAGLILLHNECHATGVHGQPEKAQALGLIVSIHLEVEQVPCYHARRGWRLVHDNGTATPVAEPPACDARLWLGMDDTPDPHEHLPGSSMGL
jgi:hypothetical protein